MRPRRIHRAALLCGCLLWPSVPRGSDASVAGLSLSAMIAPSCRFERTVTTGSAEAGPALLLSCTKGVLPSVRIEDEGVPPQLGGDTPGNAEGRYRARTPRPRLAGSLPGGPLLGGPDRRSKAGGTAPRTVIAIVQF